MGFKVNQRSVRKKFEKMKKDYEKKEGEGKGASGVSVQYSGIHRSLEDIKGRIAELNEVQQVESKRKKKEKASAEEMRKKAMEKYSATKKEHDEEPDDDVEIPARAVKRKAKQNNVSDILADPVPVKRKQSELRQRELKLREEEQRKQQLFQEYLLTQQKEAQQQQHTMNLAIMNALFELLQKIKNT